LSVAPNFWPNQVFATSHLGPPQIRSARGRRPNQRPTKTHVALSLPLPAWQVACGPGRTMGECNSPWAFPPPNCLPDLLAPEAASRTSPNPTQLPGDLAQRQKIGHGNPQPARVLRLGPAARRAQPEKRVCIYVLGEENQSQRSVITYMRMHRRKQRLLGE
jgi:hypothetical protein